MGTSLQCIYCQARVPTGEQGDHVLPAGFGGFSHEVRFKGICRRCNSKLSPLDEELLRTAPEALSRWQSNEGFKSRRGQRVGWRGTGGLARPRFLMEFHGTIQVVNPSPSEPGSVEAFDHLVFTLSDGSIRHLALHPGMTAQSVRAAMTKLGICEAELKSTHWYADSASMPWVRALVDELWPDLPKHELPTVEAGTHQVQLRVECSYSHRYLQSLVKAAFHYYLATTRSGATGREAEFAEVRQFVFDSSVPSEAARDRLLNADRPRFRLPFRVLAEDVAILPNRWMHIFLVTESDLLVQVELYLAFGPVRPPEAVVVTLRKSDTKLPASFVVPTRRWGHHYVHTDPGLDGDRKSFCEPLDIVIEAFECVGDTALSGGRGNAQRRLWPRSS